MILTERLDLQPFTAETAAAIISGDANRRRWASGFPREDDRDAAGGFLKHPNDLFGSYQISLRQTGEVIGTIGFFGPPSPEGTVMIGYGLVEQARGAGYATEAVRALIGYAFSRSEVEKVVADTELDNIASCRVLEKAGFMRTGSTEKAHWYELVR